nr:hypothetical protein [Burkholderia sp. ABCPW 111]
MFDVWRLAFGVWRLAFGVWRLTFGVRRSAFGVRRLASGKRQRKFEVMRRFRRAECRVRFQMLPDTRPYAMPYATANDAERHARRAAFARTRDASPGACGGARRSGSRSMNARDEPAPNAPAESPVAPSSKPAPASAGAPGARTPPDGERARAT